MEFDQSYFLGITSKRMHPYQRVRASITELVLELRKVIETGRLVGVVMARLVRFWILGTRQAVAPSALPASVRLPKFSGIHPLRNSR